MVQVWLPIILSAAAFITSAVVFVQRQLDRGQSKRDRERLNHVELEQILAEAWDALGGAPFTSVVLRYTEDPHRAG